MIMNKIVGARKTKGYEQKETIIKPPRFSGVVLEVRKKVERRIFPT